MGLFDDPRHDAKAAAPAPTATRDRPLTIADLLRRAEASLSRGVGTVWVEGELAEWKQPASGHAYFTVRDREAAVGMVMWRSDVGRQRNLPELGARVRVRGKLGIFPRDGRMQFYADAIEPAGLGAAAVAFEELKAKLRAEGLFAIERKRPLPALPRRIGVATSAQGAAVRDIIRTVARRYPVPILVADCAVQGPSAPGQIAAAIALLARHDVDVIIVGRGGGSAGDLAAFNDERVVRAVAACAVPVVSAVGHEVDLSLCDLVADMRASTPTAAAELVVPVRADLRAALTLKERRLRREITVRIASARQEIDQLMMQQGHSVLRLARAGRAAHARLERRLAAAAPRAQLAKRRHQLTQLSTRLAAVAPDRRIASHRATLDRLLKRASVAAHRTAEARRSSLGNLAGRLSALSPLAVLERGFAVVRHESGANFVRDVSELSVGELIRVRVARGSLTARVEQLQQAKVSGDEPGTS